MGAVFPGTFDPFTNGHLDIAERAARIFGEVTVAVVDSPRLKTFFSVDERVEQVKSACKNISQVKIESFSGLLVDYLKERNEIVIVRGLRAVSDYEYEIQMALMNKSLSQEVETCFLAAREVNSFVSSSLVKNVWLAGGKIDHLVPELVLADLSKHRLSKEKEEI